MSKQYGIIVGSGFDAFAGDAEAQAVTTRFS